MYMCINYITTIRVLTSGVSSLYHQTKLNTLFIFSIERAINTASYDMTIVQKN